MSANTKAMKAAQNEWNRLRNKKVWGETVVRHWSDVCAEARKKHKEINVGRVFGICVEKGSELAADDPRRKFKYRVVFQGNNVTNQKWEWALFQDLESSPASMQAGKCVDSYACFPGHACQQSDAEQAYVQAELKGTETWIALPKEAWPASWFDKKGNPLYDQPVVKLKKALYGHPDAGTYWEQHCERAVRSIGFEPVVSWPSCYFHKEWNVLLSVHVDDFKMSGPENNLALAWSKLRTHIEMDDPVPAGLYLGCNNHYKTEKDVMKVTYDMKHYLTTAVEAYQKVCITATGKRAALKKVATPFVEEDQLAARAKAPCAEGPCIQCEWCVRAYFPGQCKV